MIGLAIQSLQTPALLVDLDIMEANLHRMAHFFSSRSSKLRPHFKNHKCLDLAQRQVDAGAIGITAATLPETEALVNAGFQSILIANEITGEHNLKKLIELASETEIIAVVDNEKVVDDIVRLSAGKKHHLSLVVDIDVGLKRCGVLPGAPALALAQKIVATGLTFSGLMGYEGHLQRYIKSEESDAVRMEAMQALVTTRNLLMLHKIPVNIVSAGGTGTYAIAGKTTGITEVQAGNYLFMDTSYAPFAPDFTPSLRLLTTVISQVKGERFVVNAGIKEISAERGMPGLVNLPGTILRALHAEHGLVDLEDPSIEINVGDNVALSIFYSDGTVNLHRKIYGIRNNSVETIFTIM